MDRINLMTKEELTDWAMNIFWPLYTDLCKTPFPTKWKGGPRGAAVKKIQVLNPSEELRARIILGIQAQILHRKKLYQKLGSMQAWNTHTEKNKFYCNRNGETWINQIGWDDEIPQLEQDREVTVGSKCFCGLPVHGPRFDKCTNHLSFKDGKLTGGLSEELRDYYRKHPEIRNFTREQSINFVRQNISKIGK